VPGQMYLARRLEPPLTPLAADERGSGPAVSCFLQPRAFMYVLISKALQASIAARLPVGHSQETPFLLRPRSVDFSLCALENWLLIASHYFWAGGWKTGV
jgi:hypothetical protein